MDLPSIGDEVVRSDVEELLGNREEVRPRVKIEFPKRAKMTESKDSIMWKSYLASVEK